ncbi:hypothetical protein [Laceyella putida]|uniref:Uncharacterized protein n=1 Tax=Laceyella putida TaxID=110101 RepID=A0ABW2RRV7_9BACL
MTTVNSYQEIPSWVRRGHDRQPNRVVCGLYELFDLIEDFGPMFASFFRWIGRTAMGTWDFLVNTSMITVNIAMLAGIIYLSVGHSYRLCLYAGFSGIGAWVAVGVWEAAFIYCSQVIQNSFKKGKKQSVWAWTGFLMGFAFVVVSNYMGMAENRIGKTIGVSTPFLLLVMKGVLAYQFKKEEKTKERVGWFSRLFFWRKKLDMDTKLDTSKRDTSQTEKLDMETGHVDMDTKLDTSKLDMPQTEKLDTKKLDMDISKLDMKVDTGHVDTEKLDMDKLDMDTSKLDMKMDTDAKLDTEKLDIEQVDTKLDTNKSNTTNAELSTVDTVSTKKRDTLDKAEDEKLDTKKRDIQKADMPKLDTEKLDMDMNVDMDTSGKLDTKLDMDTSKKLDTEKLDMSQSKKLDTKKLDMETVDIENLDTEIELDNKVLDIAKYLEGKKSSEETLKEIIRVVKWGLETKAKEKKKKSPGRPRLMKEGKCNTYVAKEAKNILNVIDEIQMQEDQTEQTG